MKPILELFKSKVGDAGNGPYLGSLDPPSSCEGERRRNVALRSGVLSPGIPLSAHGLVAEDEEPQAQRDEHWKNERKKSFVDRVLEIGTARIGNESRTNQEDAHSHDGHGPPAITELPQAAQQPAALPSPPCRHRQGNRFAVLEAAQVGSQVGSAGVALARLFLKAFHADRFQFDRERRIELPDRDWVLLDDLQDGLQRRCCPKRGSSREQLVEDRSQCVNVYRRTER